MSEPRKPIFSFLWPKPDPDAPVDDAYRQVRWVRACPRGPLRVAILAVATVAMITTTGTVILAAVSTSISVLTLVGAATCASLLALSLRGWVVGTYVNDDGIRIETTWGRTVLPWTEVTSIERVAGPAPLLGLPVRVASERVFVRTVASGPGPTARIATHVYVTSPDLWLRPEAFDMACLRLERWGSPPG